MVDYFGRTRMHKWEKGVQHQYNIGWKTHTHAHSFLKKASHN